MIDYVNEPVYKNIIGISSLWLLYPLIIYLFNKNTNCKNNTIQSYFIFTIVIIVFLWIFACCIISCLMWKIYDKTSILYKLDIIFAQGTFLSLLYLTFFVYASNINKNLKYLLPIGVGGFYLLTCKLYNDEYFEAALFSHLIFRFIGFWWTYIAFNHTLTSDRFIIISFMYWIYILYYKYIICNSQLIDCYDMDEYNKGTYELISLILYCFMIF